MGGWRPGGWERLRTVIDPAHTAARKDPSSSSPQHLKRSSRPTSPCSSSRRRRRRRRRRMRSASERFSPRILPFLLAVAHLSLFNKKDLSRAGSRAVRDQEHLHAIDCRVTPPPPPSLFLFFSLPSFHFFSQSRVLLLLLLLLLCAAGWQQKEPADCFMTYIYLCGPRDPSYSELPFLPCLHISSSSTLYRDIQGGNSAKEDGYKSRIYQARPLGTIWVKNHSRNKEAIGFFHTLLARSEFARFDATKRAQIERGQLRQTVAELFLGIKMDVHRRCCTIQN